MNVESLRRYQVMDPLGTGGQGTTYRGIDRDTHREVAIKVLSLKTNRDWKAFDLFEREVAILKTLDHPGIPRYVDSYASEETGDFFLVMSLVEGTPLSQVIAEKRRLPPGGLAKLLDDVLGILAYLHGVSPPVIHRDIKPANLLLSSTSGRVSLVDFGGVRVAARVSGGSTVIGTFGYMAPEQLHGEATTAVDIYALGATLAALHAGCEADALPHDGLRLDVESLELPQELAPLIGRMIEPDPRMRLSTVGAVREAQAKTKRMLSPPPRPAPAPPVHIPRANANTPANTPALAVPAPLQTLAQTPFPISFLVWLVASIATGTLIVFEVVALPLIVLIATAIADRQKEAASGERVNGELAQMRDTVAATRRAFAWVAGRTNPVRDRDEALPPPRD